jgi:hypothetical protein
MNHRFRTLLLLALLATGSAAPARDLPVGVARVDITPGYPVRLNGFGFRRKESEGVTQRIWAKALAIGDEEEGPAVLIAADTLGVPDELTLEMADRLARRIGMKRERLTITATHTHTAPMLREVSPTIFGTPIPPEHQANIDRYTREFTEKLEEVALAAVKDIRPSRLSWGIGTVKFAVNRRTPGGPADHDLPALFASDADGRVRAVYFSYACHAVTLSHNKVSGDWAGFAQEEVERRFPGAVALASVGCGADSNPSSGVVGDNVAACAAQGRQIADAVERLFAEGPVPIASKPEIRYSRIDLPFDGPRTRAEWEERSWSADGALAHHARLNLARIEGGVPLPTRMTYPIQTWLFGDRLAVVFIPGEPVVDYSLRLKREFDRNRLWVNGYANESRCYLPSDRIWKEGGYEGGDAMVYYDRPHRFAQGVEQKVIDAVAAQLGKTFLPSR